MEKVLSNYGLNNPTEVSHKLSFASTQPCPVCNFLIGALAGSKDAICQNCGYKDPCCE